MKFNLQAFTDDTPPAFGFMSRADKLKLTEIASSYCKQVEVRSDGIKFTDGDSNTLVIPVMKSDPCLTITPIASSDFININDQWYLQTFIENGIGYATCSRLGDGVISITCTQGSDRCSASISGTTATFELVGEEGLSMFVIEVASTEEYRSSSIEFSVYAVVRGHLSPAPPTPAD